ncbi:hypothetical protein M2244_002475 [Rhodoferax antarcticus]|nr:hypothetical protein [Rhodoferax antarcticus]
MELRCALWGSPPSITAFGLPALSCGSVRAARLLPAQGLGSYIASASQVSASALERRYGLSRLACASSGRAIATRGIAASSTTVGTRPLRPPASLLHNAALPSVPASRCAKAPLGAGHRFAPYRVKATGVMQSGLRWRRSHSRRRFPVAGAPYAPPSARPCGCACTVASVRRCALCVRSVACGQACRVCLRPPVGLAAARLGYALNCPSAPRGGSLSQRKTGGGVSGAYAPLPKVRCRLRCAVGFSGACAKRCNPNLTSTHTASRRSIIETLIFLALLLAVCFKMVVCKPSVHKGNKAMCDPRPPRS